MSCISQNGAGEFEQVTMEIFQLCMVIRLDNIISFNYKSQLYNNHQYIYINIYSSSFRVCFVNAVCVYYSFIYVQLQILFKIKLKYYVSYISRILTYSTVMIYPIPKPG